MSGVDVRLLGAVLKRLAHLHGNRLLTPEQLNAILSHLAEVERIAREGLPESAPDDGSDAVGQSQEVEP